MDANFRFSNWKTYQEPSFLRGDFFFVLRFKLTSYSLSEASLDSVSGKKTCGLGSGFSSAFASETGICYFSGSVLGISLLLNFAGSVFSNWVSALSPFSSSLFPS